MYQGKGWKKYEYKGIRYRSKWEVSTAILLEQLNIRFEYEKKDPVTSRRPDFYFPDLDRYLEIHPDIYGAKILPENCVLVKTQKHTEISALAIGFKLQPRLAYAFIAKSSDKKIKALEKATFDLSVYLRRLIEETGDVKLNFVNPPKQSYLMYWLEQLFQGHDRRDSATVIEATEKLRELYKSMRKDGEKTAKTN